MYAYLLFGTLKSPVDYYSKLVEMLRPIKNSPHVSEVNNDKLSTKAKVVVLADFLPCAKVVV